MEKHKFKVGDKVRILDFKYGRGIKKSTIGQIREIIYDDGTNSLQFKTKYISGDGNKLYDWWFDAEILELVENTITFKYGDTVILTKLLTPFIEKFGEFIGHGCKFIEYCDDDDSDYYNFDEGDELYKGDVFDFVCWVMTDTELGKQYMEEKKSK